MTDQDLGEWSELRGQAMQLIEQLYDRLDQQGFISYRLGEMLNPDTGKHIRRNYSGGEWILSTSIIPKQRNGRRGVSSDATERRQIRIDLRHHKRMGRSLPKLDDLVAQVTT